LAIKVKYTPFCSPIFKLSFDCKARASVG